MTIRPKAFVALIPVWDVSRSIAFYERLGLRVKNTFAPPDSGTTTWAALESAGARLMLSLADEPPAPTPALLFYLYCDDVVAARAELERAGLAAGPISYPFYAPRGEFRVVDPDGYAVMITHT